MLGVALAELLVVGHLCGVSNLPRTFAAPWGKDA
jgi:hypothetical protein